MRLFFLLGMVGAAVLVAILAFVLRSSPTQAPAPAVQLTAPPRPADPPQLQIQPTAVLFEFQADAGTPRGFDGGCDVGLTVRNRSRQTLSMTGIVDAASAGSRAAAPFIVQYVDPGDSGDAQVGLPIACPKAGQARASLTIREISICKLGNQYYPNCLASAAPARGTAGFEVRIGGR